MPAIFAYALSKLTDVPFRWVHMLMMFFELVTGCLIKITSASFIEHLLCPRQRIKELE